MSSLLSISSGYKHFSNRSKEFIHRYFILKRVCTLLICQFWVRSEEVGEVKFQVRSSLPLKPSINGAITKSARNLFHGLIIFITNECCLLVVHTRCFFSTNWWPYGQWCVETRRMISWTRTMLGSDVQRRSPHSVFFEGWICWTLSDDLCIVVILGWESFSQVLLEEVPSAWLGAMWAQSRVRELSRGWSQNGNPAPLPHNWLARLSSGHPHLLFSLANASSLTKKWRNWRPTLPTENFEVNADVPRSRTRLTQGLCARNSHRNRRIQAGLEGRLTRKFLQILPDLILRLQYAKANDWNSFTWRFSWNIRTQCYGVACSDVTCSMLRHGDGKQPRIYWILNWR